jgi:hypothetical protein
MPCSMILEKTQTQNLLRELNCLESDIGPDSSLILSVTKDVFTLLSFLASFDALLIVY